MLGMSQVLTIGGEVLKHNDDSRTIIIGVTAWVEKAKLGLGNRNTFTLYFK